MRLCVTCVFANVLCSQAVSMHTIKQADRVLAHCFAEHPLNERLTVGRQAQLGDAMVYRPGEIGGSVDTGATYGEYDLTHFTSLVERAINGQPEQHVLVDVGSGCGRLALAATTLWPGLRRVAGVERESSLHAIAVQAARSTALPREPPVELLCGDAEDALRAGGPLDDATILFCYSTTWCAQPTLVSFLYPRLLSTVSPRAVPACCLGTTHSRPYVCQTNHQSHLMPPDQTRSSPIPPDQTRTQPNPTRSNSITYHLITYHAAFLARPSIGDVLTDFSEVCGAHLRVGTRVIVTDKKLQSDERWDISRFDPAHGGLVIFSDPNALAGDPFWFDPSPRNCGRWGEYQFELLEALDGPNAETGGTSIGYLYEVAQSLRGSA